MTTALGRFVQDLVDSGTVNTAAALVGAPDRIVATAAAGYVDVERSRPVSEGAVFDLASLSKPVAATLALHLDHTGELPRRHRIGDVFGALFSVEPRLAERTLEDLLRHRAGLRAWAPLWRLGDDREAVLHQLLSGRLLGAEEPTYSDLGYVLWGLAVQERLGRPLVALLEERLGDACAGRPPRVEPRAGDDTAVCLLANERERELAAAMALDLELEVGPWRGVPQDGNARHLGGFPGHAGLFGSAPSLWRLGAEWLRPGALFDASVLKSALEGDGRFALGWWTGCARRHAGTSLSSSSFGMVGFTGGSWFVDPVRQLVLVLLAHRVAADVDLAAARRRFHALAVAGAAAR